MKVLQFITRLDLGGAQEICLDLCERLLRRGDEVHLLTGTGGELIDEARRMPGLTLHAWDDWHHAIRPLDDLRCAVRLAGLLRRESFDLLHTHCSKAGLVGRLAAFASGAPERVVHHVHGWSFNRTQTPLRHGLYAGLERLAARRDFVLLSCCHATSEQGASLGIGRDEDRRVVVNAIDRRENLRRRDREAIRRRLGIGRRDCLFLQLGNLKPQKDPLTFARAACIAGKQAHRAVFRIAGDGPLRQQTLAIARAGGLEQRFAVMGWRTDVADLLAAADVMVLTSRFEGLPMAVLRAMAAELPVIATAVDGTPEAVADGHSGILVPAEDPEATAAAMVRLALDPRERRRMGQAGRRRSQLFTADRAAAETLAVYDSAPSRGRIADAQRIVAARERTRRQTVPARGGIHS